MNNLLPPHPCREDAECVSYRGFATAEEQEEFQPQEVKSWGEKNIREAIPNLSFKPSCQLRTGTRC